MKVMGIVILIGFMISQACTLSTDQIVTKLIADFNEAGVDLRLDRDQIIRTDIKSFSGFIVDSQNAYQCGIMSIDNKPLTDGELVYFQLEPDGMLRQIFIGKVILKRQYRVNNDEQKNYWRVLLTSEEAEKGYALCSKQLKVNE